MKKFLMVSFLLIVGIAMNAIAAEKQFSIMSYNPENLFDAEKDKGKNDWAFLPRDFPDKPKECKKNSFGHYRDECLRTDWTESKVQIKLNQIASVVKSIGHLPDVLTLVEVENEKILKRLAGVLGYSDYLITNGADERGIDNAILFNKSEFLELMKWEELKPVGKLRTILVAEFKLDKKYPLTILVNHWPSQGGPTSKRLAMAEFVGESVAKLAKKNKKMNFIITGDFNTIPEDHPNPITQIMLDKYKLKDIHDEFMKSKEIPKKLKKSMALGTYFFAPKMTWNVLDRFLISPRLMKDKKFFVDLESYEIVSPSFITRTYHYEEKGEFLYQSQVGKTPIPYNFDASNEGAAGFSDHFPILIKLKVL